MKTDVVSWKKLRRDQMKQPRKPRTAYILFAKDTPFKPKVIRNRKKYSRKVKHKNASN